MSDLGTYTFLPWLRQGIANKIDDADLDTSVQTRASVNVKLKISGKPVEGSTDLEQEISKDIELYGPGDIVGIDSKSIVKVEPRNWITNFETNYLPYIDFYDEDFPWRYTPAKPNAANVNRLRPWLMLVVLKESEFEESTNLSGRPLPFIKVTDTGLFPPSAELWAWAHVHVNKSLISGSTDMVKEANENGPVLSKFEQTLNQNPDLAYSRIVCPRKLESKTGYHAFLMPVFETGRLSGLGLDPATSPYATQCSWDAYSSGTKLEPTHFPHYYRWYFRTSSVGDFEYLVRLLKPKQMDSRVGRRDMDVQHPGANLPGISSTELGGVLKLGGALQIPFDTLKQADKDDVTKYENWAQPFPHPFQEGLAAFVNLAEDYQEKTISDAHNNADLPQEVKDGAAPEDPGDDPDPLITAPIYGRWPAKISRLLKDKDGNPLPQNQNWIHDLNLDPRYRVASGFGTDVVKENQETYMDAAWGQIGDILKANQQIKWAQLAKEVSYIWYDTHLKTLQATNSEKFFAMAAPMDKHILLQSSPIVAQGVLAQGVGGGNSSSQGSTLFHSVNTSVVPRIAISAPMRRVMRPRARIITKLQFPENQRPETLAARINAGEVLPAPPKVVPPDLPTLDRLAEEMEPKAPKFVKNWTRSVPWLKWIFLALALIILAVLGIIFGPDLSVIDTTILTWGSAGLGAAALFIFLFLYFNKTGKRVKAADSIKPENQTPELVDKLPRSSKFVLTRPGVDFNPKRGGKDSPTAERFKLALANNYRLIQASAQVAQEPPKVQLNFTAMVQGTFEAINPEVTALKRYLATIYIPERIKVALFEIFEEAMAYPEFDMPMYKPLTDISSELFLPNIQFIEQNSISLLETNQRFIEAYMVGLNHEFGRELLWREFPTDQRGSYFRQFWDVSSFLNRDNLEDEALREKLKDIPELHFWSKYSDLGDHDNREKPGENEEELVLVIRGELLKKYPTAVIYAHRAEWQQTDNKIDKTKPRNMVGLTEAEAQNPPASKLLTPLYEAKVDPDIYFFGFDLTANEANGETAEKPDDPGWFFVIKERPGEPRFGFDIDQDGTPGGTKNYWNDIAWTEVPSSGGAGDFLQTSPAPSISLVAPPGSATTDQKTQHDEDVQVSWTGDVSAAEMAYIMYQVPVLVAVHAQEMLP